MPDLTPAVTSEATATARPALDRELGRLIADLPDFGPVSEQTLPLIRPYASTPVEPLLDGRRVTRREEVVRTADGHDLAITVISPEQTAGPEPAAGPELRPGRQATPAPGVLWLHGGGMVMGDRFSQLDIPLDWLDALGAVVVTVEYRLAPEASGSRLVEDAYLGLVWLAEHAAELGVDPDRIVVAGTSAGGGLAAGVTLMARDLGAPLIAAQVLVCPMLDHRNASVSARQYAGPGIWSQESNAFAWRAVLGDAGDDVPVYASPGTAPDLAGLPTTYIDAGSAEVFRDEDVEYASRIWAAGGQAELHVWAGGFHGFDAMYPDAALSRTARATRTAWLRRTLD